MKLSIKNPLFLISIIIAGSVTSTYANDYNTELGAANDLSSLEIIVDKSSTPEEYRLGETITRREMLKIMINLSPSTVEDKCEWKFADLQTSDWWCKYAEEALKQWYIAANNNFRPDDNISKVEALKMVMQAKNLSKNLVETDWRKAYVLWWLFNWILEDSKWTYWDFSDYDTQALRWWIFVITQEANKKNTDLETQVKIANYYWFWFLWNSLNVNSEDDCEKINQLFDKDIDCTINNHWIYYWNINLSIFPMWNNFYNISLYEMNYGNSTIFSSVYNNLTNREYNAEVIDSKFWFISIWNTNQSNFEFSNNSISRSYEVLDFASIVKNDTIWEFNLNIRYKFKEWLSEEEKDSIINWNLPYYVGTWYGAMWMWGSYDILKENWDNVSELDIFNQKWTYFADYWGSQFTSDILLLTTYIPENPYFSEMTIQFLNTWAYNDDEKKQLILDFVKNLEWTNTFSIE